MAGDMILKRALIMAMIVVIFLMLIPTVGVHAQVSKPTRACIEGLLENRRHPDHEDAKAYFDELAKFIIEKEAIVASESSRDRMRYLLLNRRVKERIAEIVSNTTMTEEEVKDLVTKIVEKKISNNQGVEDKKKKFKELISNLLSTIKELREEIVKNQGKIGFGIKQSEKSIIHQIEEKLDKVNDPAKKEYLRWVLMLLNLQQNNAEQFKEFIEEFAFQGVIEKIIDDLLAPSNDEFITSKGAVFTRADDPQKEGFKKAWKDPSGMIWGEYIGEANHANGIKKCKELGAELPTKEDLERLTEYFERGSVGYFTDKGRSELYKMLPDMKDRWFWSASINPLNTVYAFGFNGNNGSIGNYDYRNNSYSVRCVSRSAW